MIVHPLSRQSDPGWTLEPAGSWRDEALCAQVGGDVWFPDKGGTVNDAKDVCSRCPVRRECLEAGLDEKFGIHGGLSERERRRLRASGWRAGDPLPPVTVRPRGPAAA